MRNDGPIFITGSPRSGTSIFYLALKQATKLPGHHEGHFLGLYSGLEKAIARHYKMFAARAADERNTIAHIPEGSVRKGMVSQLLHICNQVHGSTTWIDKSAGVPMLDFIHAMAEQDVPFITFFMYRRSLENVYSRLKKFPQHDLRYHTQDWTNVMAKWRAVRSALPAGSFVEIEQKSIADHPDEVAEDVARVMELTGQQRDMMARAFATRRPQQLASESVGRILTLDAVEWTGEQKAMFMEIAGEEMERWHFTSDDRYRIAEGNHDV